MTSLLPIVALAAALTQGQAPAPAFNFDQTVNVTRGMRISVNNQAGEVIMRTWDRDSVRVQARHNVRGRVNLRTADNAVWISGGGMGAIDYEITIPAWMPVKVTGAFNYIELNGMGAEVSAENVRGDIDVKGGRGFVTVKSIEGKITISGTQGKIDATSVNDDVFIDNAAGEIAVDATNGHITLTNIRADVVGASALNGNVRYTGTIADKGRYNIVTHNGNIRMEVQPTPNATFYVRSYEGGFSQTVNAKAQGEPRRGRRNVYVAGSGSAQVELESFQGRISILGRQ
jgi:hypothetical protein